MPVSSTRTVTPMSKVRATVAPPAPGDDPKVRRLPVKGPAVQYRPVILAAVTLGFGMAALLEGFLLRELLQWHVIAGERFPVTGVPPQIALEHLRINMRWNGVYYALAWMVAAGGIASLWRAGLRHPAARSTRKLAGSLLVGWGLFKLCEGLLMHHVLGLHHVRESAGAAAWDAVWLVLGSILIVAGWVNISSRHS